MADGRTPANNLCRSISNPTDEAAEGLFAKVPGILEAFDASIKRSHLLTSTREDVFWAPQPGASHCHTRSNRYG